MENTIIPAIMPQSFRDIEKHVEIVLDVAGCVQLDIMDGVFVPEKTWPFKEFKSKRSDMNQITDYAWRDLQNEDIGWPYWQDMDYELDLMVQDADLYLDQWIALGPKRIIFHIESLNNIEKLLNEVQGIRSFIEIGLSLNNDTDFQEILPHLEMIDCVQVMGIARIGYQGEGLDERVFEHIQSIKIHAPHIPIQVDGSVNRSTIERFRDAGVERFVVGSAIFAGDNPREGVEELDSFLI
ncbi:hypothetical protein H6776_01430 [Candidatus Nomurabacteria bacterium]|nr:hypothetical protein [Candidatus Nomurabacteria bacterium]